MTTAPSSPPDPSRPPLARIVDLALVVPVEVGSRLLDVVPAVADKIPPAADRVRREIVLARFLGKLAVDQGVRELRSRLIPDDATDVSSEPSASEVAVSEVAASEVRRPSQDEPVAASAPDDAPPATPPEVVADDLALAHYDHLSSAQVVAKLPGLDADEREAIEIYERVGRHRRTILGKIDQLRTAGAES